ncbi:MAG: rRNA pseudouridine synthase [Tyzzerella sp.]|nr:rRNA pseudouridine synthase [Tyzzerella sp.]
MAVIMMRLDKYLADMGIGTRTEVKKLIRQGKIAVDGAVIKSPEAKIDTEKNLVTLGGKPVSYETFEYYMLNKPAGVVSATTDAKDKTVIDLIETRKRKDLFPVGRLDKDTEGLLLITNDGELAHRLLAPKKHVDKGYYAKVEGVVTEEDQKAFAEGVSLGGGEMARPAELEIIVSDEISEIRLTIQEGKFHQVKRMFESVGKKVIYLKRLSMGTLVLDETLALGEYRKLTEEELKALC